MTDQIDQSCIWSQWDEESDIWEPSCSGSSFRLDEDTPTKNGMKFCCYCGRPLVEELWRDDDH